MRHDTFGRLAVRLTAEDAAAERRAHRHRTDEIGRRTITQARRFADQLVQTRVDIVGELDLGDWAQTVSAHANRDADNAAFVDRHVEPPLLACLFMYSCGCAKTPPKKTDQPP